MTISDSPGLASTVVYFSFGTLTTAGSGEIAPLHPIARSLCNLEAMVGQLYPATWQGLLRFKLKVRRSAEEQKLTSALGH
jgi:hypothetical protein